MIHNKTKKYQLALLIVFVLTIVISENAYAEYNVVYGRNAREIQFPIGKDYYLDNGERINTDTPAYLTDEGITMIPLRQICKIFDIDDSNITWDEKSKTVSITIADWVTTFAANQSHATKFNVIMEYSTFWWGAAKSCHNEIKSIGDKSVFFVPFRAYGDLFGFPMSWNDETHSAIFNEGYKFVDDIEIESPLELSGSDPYFVIFNWLFRNSLGMHFDLKYIAVDMTEAKSYDYTEFIAMMKSFCDNNGYVFMQDTRAGLFEKGLLKSLEEYPDYKYFKNGILIMFQDISVTENRIVINASKWQSPDGAFGGNLILENQRGIWTVTSNNRVWMS